MGFGAKQFAEMKRKHMAEYELLSESEKKQLMINKVIHNRYNLCEISRYLEDAKKLFGNLSIFFRTNISKGPGSVSVIYKIAYLIFNDEGKYLNSWSKIFSKYLTPDERANLIVKIRNDHHLDFVESYMIDQLYGSTGTGTGTGAGAPPSYVPAIPSAPYEPPPPYEP